MLSFLIASICGLDIDQIIVSEVQEVISWVDAHCWASRRCSLQGFRRRMLTANQQMCIFLSPWTCVVHLDCTVPRWMHRRNDADLLDWLGYSLAFRIFLQTITSQRHYWQGERRLIWRVQKCCFHSSCIRCPAGVCDCSCYVSEVDMSLSYCLCRTFLNSCFGHSCWLSWAESPSTGGARAGHWWLQRLRGWWTCSAQFLDSVGPCTKRCHGLSKLNQRCLVNFLRWAVASKKWILYCSWLKDLNKHQSFKGRLSMTSLHL